VNNPAFNQKASASLYFSRSHNLLQRRIFLNLDAALLPEGQYVAAEADLPSKISVDRGKSSSFLHYLDSRLKKVLIATYATWTTGRRCPKQETTSPKQETTSPKYRNQRNLCGT
jgi:hypothetical protein